MWQSRASGLKLREDEYSWQGASCTDDRFFVRRLKQEPHVFTDLLLGDLNDDSVEKLLAEFISVTGGIIGDQIVFSAIADQNDEQKSVIHTYDRTSRIGANVIVLLGRMVRDCSLDPKFSKWNARIRLHPSAT